MKLSSTLLGAIAVVKADDHPDLFGTCVKDEKSDRVLPVYFGEANSVEECLAGCRSLNEAAGYPILEHATGVVKRGFTYAGLEFKTECYCGEEPADGFDALYTWPDRCNMRCGGEGAIWQNCGGAGAMNTWSVPTFHLNGQCVYDHPRDGRVFNGPAETGVQDMTVEQCKKYCFDQDYAYFGLEYGDSCYCGDNADRIVPALPQECDMPCTGDADETCGSAYRINAYGPSFQAITANHVVFEHATVHKWFQVNIDLKLEDNTANPERSNIYGLMTDGAIYPNIGSQIPAVFLEPESMEIQVCMFLDGTSNCLPLLTEVDADTWFKLTVEQNCWIDLNGDLWCYVTVLKDGVFQFFWYNSTPETFYDVNGVIGNTYGQEDIVAASGLYHDFNLDQSEDGTTLTFAVTEQPTHTDASNVA